VGTVLRVDGKIFLISLAAMTCCFTPQVLADVSCRAPEGLTALTSSSEKFLVFGEVHGTTEAPALFAESVCAVVTSGKKVLVGLEQPEASAAAFKEFLQSEGGPEDVRKLLAESQWSQQASQFPDGRTSQAMLGLVQRLRELRGSGNDVAIAPFVRTTAWNQGESQTPYEKGLASSLIEAASNGAYDFVMVLVGNVHAYKAVVPAGAPFEPMVMHLPRDETVTLNMVSDGGTAWNCRPGCDIHPLRVSNTENHSGIVLGRNIAPGYDGIFNIGTASGSPPVLFTLPACTPIIQNW